MQLKPTTESINHGRRGFLKLSRGAAIGLAAAGTVAALGGASGYRWWQHKREPGYENMQVLRAQDVLLFSALLPVVIGNHPANQSALLASASAAPAAALNAQGEINESTHQQALSALDRMLAAGSPAMQKQIYDLVDLLTIKATQGPVTGYWGSWEHASTNEISAFLTRWRDSRVSLFRFGYAGICQLLQMAWYGLPSTWSAIGYPGPPAFLKRATDARS